MQNFNCSEMGTENIPGRYNKNKKLKDLGCVFVSCDRQRESMERTADWETQDLCSVTGSASYYLPQIMFLHMQKRGQSNGLQGNGETQM